MRSSIACSRCRRSKVKCVNNGVGTQCRACETSGRDCEYPANVGGSVGAGMGGVGGGVSRMRRDSVPVNRTDGNGMISASPATGGSLADADRRARQRQSRPSAYSSPYASAAGNGTAMRDSPRPLLDALDPKVLTANVWLELFDIYEAHYSADFPFLHPTTFKKPLNTHQFQSQSQLYQSALSYDSSTTTAAGTAGGGSAGAVRPPGSPEFLLAFLALTARFHPKLVAHHSPPIAGRASNPLMASEYYADCVKERLLSFVLGQRTEDLEIVQAYLMLAFHEWGMCRGWSSWKMLGLAVRASVALGLGVDLEASANGSERCLPLGGEVATPASSGAPASNLHGSTGGSLSTSSGGLLASEDSSQFLQQEIRRRTFWACFIMDRYLSSGSNFRPWALARPAPFFQAQLPASERKFMFTDRVRTLMLGEEAKREGETIKHEGNGGGFAAHMIESRFDKVELEVGENEGIVSRYVKVLELYGKVLHWACEGGRESEQYAPWDSRSKFHALRQQCQNFKATLPRAMSLSRNNLQAHIESRSSAAYMLVHVVFLLCQIYLQREYLPLLPLRCTKPSGPTRIGDEEGWSKDDPSRPEEWWTDSANECFAAARDIVDLVSTCKEYCRLVETPIVGFALYTVSILGTYCITFPQMDPRGYLCTPVAQRGGSSSTSRSPGFVASTNAAEMLAGLEQRLYMANGWYKTIRRTGKFLKKVKDAFAQAEAKTEGAKHEGVTGDYPGSRGRGPSPSGDEYRMFERSLAESAAASSNGFDQEDDVEMADATNQYSPPPSHAGSRGSPDLRSDDRDYHARLGNGNGAAHQHHQHGASAHEPSRAESSGGGGSWSAINTTPQQHNHASTSTPAANNGGFRSYDSFPAQQQQQQQQQSYGGFRPAYSADTARADDGPDRSILSPPTAMQQTSPPSREYNHASSSWNASNSSSMPPPPSSYTNGNGTASTSATPAKGLQAMTTPAPFRTPQETLTHLLSSPALPRDFFADDLYAFAEGRDLAAITAATGAGQQETESNGGKANAVLLKKAGWLNVVLTRSSDGLLV